MTSEVTNMWNNINCLWIILIILLISCCGSGTGNSCGCGNTCSCSNNCSNSCDCCC